LMDRCEEQEKKKEWVKFFNVGFNYWFLLLVCCVYFFLKKKKKLIRLPMYS